MILRSHNSKGGEAKNASSLNTNNAAVASAANVSTATHALPIAMKLHLNTNMSSYNQAQQPGSPQSPHTMATKCGFSPNVTTQSCIVVDDKDAQIKSLQGEIVSLKDVIKSRDAEIVKLRREIHKLKVSWI